MLKRPKRVALANNLSATKPVEWEATGALIELFVVGATARAAAEIVGVNRNTARTFYHRLRQLIASKLPNYDLSGEVEADESYFSGVRKGQRGRAAIKVPVFAC